MPEQGLTVETLLIENRHLRVKNEALERELATLRGDAVRRAVDPKTWLVPLKELPELTGMPLAEIKRLKRGGKIRGYGGTQTQKKRPVFNVFEVLAAIKQETQTAHRLGSDLSKRIFERHNIPSSLALSGVSS